VKFNNFYYIQPAFSAQCSLVIWLLYTTSIVHA